MKIPKHIEVDEQMAKLGKNSWSVPRLIKLSKDLPVMEIPLDHLNLYCVYDTVSLRDMVMHMNAVEEANLDFPIIIDEDGELMDGRHRLMKAMKEGLETIKAVRFEENPRPCVHDENA